VALNGEWPPPCLGGVEDVREADMWPDLALTPPPPPTAPPAAWPPGLMPSMQYGSLYPSLSLASKSLASTTMTLRTTMGG